MKGQTRNAFNKAHNQIYGKGRHVGSVDQTKFRDVDLTPDQVMPQREPTKAEADALRKKREAIVSAAGPITEPAPGKAICGDCGGTFRAKKDGQPYAHNCSS